MVGADGDPKDWVLLIKLGKGGSNCNASKTQNGYTYECGVLYADNQNQTLRRCAAGSGMDGRTHREGAGNEVLCLCILLVRETAQ